MSRIKLKEENFFNCLAGNINFKTCEHYSGLADAWAKNGKTNEEIDWKSTFICILWNGW